MSFVIWQTRVTRMGVTDSNKWSLQKWHQNIVSINASILCPQQCHKKVKAKTKTKKEKHNKKKGEGEGEEKTQQRTVRSTAAPSPAAPLPAAPSPAAPSPAPTTKTETIGNIYCMYSQYRNIGLTIRHITILFVDIVWCMLMLIPLKQTVKIMEHQLFPHCRWSCSPDPQPPASLSEGFRMPTLAKIASTSWNRPLVC